MGAKVDLLKGLSEEQKKQVEKLLKKKKGAANGPTPAEVKAAVAKVVGEKKAGAKDEK